MSYGAYLPSMAFKAIRRAGQRVLSEGETEQADRQRTWNDPNLCPFCGAAIPDGDQALTYHIQENRACVDRFAELRMTVAEDIVQK
ncbi:hypothetical protein HSB1_31990 [Halogranum salarium B-1]|uniref:Uncharacterized protein n=2 Tax=Halogranum rubrum TaxID=553466 RepID=J3JEW5_9EURY|nr:hypothetical protein HSB1_31990 [Halogranum salarium B-1]